MGWIADHFGHKAEDESGYALGGKSGRGKPSDRGWNPSREHHEPMRDGKPLVEGRDYDGYELGSR